MTPVQPTDPALRHDAAAAVLASPLAIDGHAGFAAAVHATLAAAFAREARVLLWVDEDFGSWPLDDAALLDALGSWLRRPLRQLRLLARDYDALARAHPRFARWRADWTHAIDARRPDPAMRAPLPTLVLDDGPVLLRLAQRDPHVAWRRAMHRPRGRRGTISARCGSSPSRRGRCGRSDSEAARRWTPRRPPPPVGPGRSGAAVQRGPGPPTGRPDAVTLSSSHHVDAGLPGFDIESSCERLARDRTCFTEYF